MDIRQSGNVVIYLPRVAKVTAISIINYYIENDEKSFYKTTNIFHWNPFPIGHSYLDQDKRYRRPGPTFKN